MQIDYNNDLLPEVFGPKLEEWGFPTDQVEWSLGYCQGDGVAFYGSIDLEQFIRKAKVAGKYAILVRKCEADATIGRNSFGHHYSHWNTMDVGLRSYGTETPQRNEWCESLRELLDEAVKDVSRELEKAGYEALTVLASDIEDFSRTTLPLLGERGTGPVVRNTPWTIQREAHSTMPLVAVKTDSEGLSASRWELGMAGRRCGAVSEGRVADLARGGRPSRRGGKGRWG